MPVNTTVARYDRLTRTFHWLSTAVVICRLASAHIWENLKKGTPLRKVLQSVRISLGIALAVLIAARILWRLSGGNLAGGRQVACKVRQLCSQPQVAVALISGWNRFLSGATYFYLRARRSTLS